jgi:hypothetical protein
MLQLLLCQIIIITIKIITFTRIKFGQKELLSLIPNSLFHSLVIEKAIMMVIEQLWISVQRCTNIVKEFDFMVFPKLSLF